MNRHEAHPQCVLMVDDEETTRMLAEQVFTDAGHGFAEAADGEAALDWLRTNRADIVLLDVHMPGIDGFETCARIRAMDGLSRLPILMVTASEDLRSIDLAFAAGATDFEAKPVNWHLLRRRVEYMMRAADDMNALVASERRVRAAQRIAGVGNWEWSPAQGAGYWSEQCRRILGLWDSASALDMDGFLDHMPPAEREMVEETLARVVAEGSALEREHGVIRPDGERRTVRSWFEATEGRPGVPPALCGAMQDITERRAAESRIRSLAFTDTLTGLPNRAAFLERIDQALSVADRHARRLGLLFIDLDDFKRINDTFGHSVGDELLKGVAARIQDCLRSSDAVCRGNDDPPLGTVARLGGDEFTVLLSEVSTPVDGERVATRILEALGSSVRVGEHDVFVTPSIGVAVYPDDGDTREALMSSADIAMYGAKREGKQRVCRYDPELGVTKRRRSELDQRMRSALERGEFQVHYQPQYNLAVERFDAAEALLRWDCDGIGPVTPNEFIPMAEENGLIVPIGEWVLREACRQAKAWIDRGIPLTRMAVNISVLQFAHPGFVELVDAILMEAELPADRLELEITESLLAVDVEGAVRTLQALKERGVQISIDDFGTGYSSLSQLKRFPVDRLKIDGSFVRDVATGTDDATIADAVIGLARCLDLDVVAEGVESEEQLTFLRARHCDEVQGFLVGRPGPPATIERVFESDAAGPGPSAAPDDRLATA